MSTIRAVVLVLFFQASAMAMDLPELQDHISKRTVHVKMDGAEDGCTGFFVSVPNHDEPVIATNIHCITINTQIEAIFMNQPAKIGGVYVQKNRAAIFLKPTKIIAYHPMADLVILESPFKDQNEVFEIVEGDLEIGSNIYSMRHDWKSEKDDLLFLKGKIIATRSEHGTKLKSHIYHRGQVIVSGFSGSGLVNEDGQIVGINFANLSYAASIAAHRDVFQSLVWLDHKIDAIELFKKHLDYDRFPMNDIFSDYASTAPAFMYTAAEHSAYAFQIHPDRVHTLFGVGIFVFHRFIPYLGREYMADKKPHLSPAQKAYEKMGTEAIEKLKTKLNISPLKTMLDCARLRAAHDSAKVFENKKPTDDEKQQVVETCDKYLYFLKLDKDNYQRLYKAGDVSKSFEEMLKLETASIDQYR